MRPLNRPMFRYGGPIKEGIMNGMKDNRVPFDNGGYLSNLAAKTAALFNPLKKAKVVQKGISSIKGIPGFFASKMQKSVPKVLRDKQGRVIGEGTDLVPTYFGKDPTVRAIGGAYKYATGPTATNLIGKATQFATSPTAIGAGLLYTDALPGGKPLFGTRNILGQKFDEETGIKTEGLFGRDLPAKKQLEEQRAKKAAQEEANKIIAQQTLEAEKNKKLEKQDPKVFEDRKKYYYKLMGLENMNKEAIYDSLIDASKIVGEQSSIKEGLKSGDLQSRIIDAISKNLDDQTKLKRQIDAAVLKGEIEKDIYQAKGGSSSEQLIKALAESGNLTEQEVARSRLGLPINVSQAIQVASAAKKGAPLTHDDVVLAATNFAALDNKPIKQQISSDEVKDKVGSGKQFANELAVVEAALGANPTAADDGFYIIGTKLIEVVKGKPIPRN